MNLLIVLEVFICCLYAFKTILSIIYCIPSNIENLIDFVSFVAWVFFGLTFLATIFCKFTKAKADRVIKVCFCV